MKGSLEQQVHFASRRRRVIANSTDVFRRLEVILSQNLDFVRMCSEAILSMCAVAEGLVAGASAPTVRLHYLSVDDD
jgi:hypothetical protein